MRFSALLPLSISLISCAPAYVKIGSDADIINETENNDTPAPNRCCYTIEMSDDSNNGWDQGFIEVLVDDNLYASVRLPGGEGYQEICPTQGSNLSMIWHRAEANQEIQFTVLSPENEILAQERRPREGTFLEVDVECTETNSVPADYQEEGSIGNVYPDDPDEPDEPDDQPDTPDSVFDGEYTGYFSLTNTQTGYNVCEKDMLVEIKNGELFSSDSCNAPNGHELFIEHNGFVEANGNSNENSAQIFGGVEMIVPNGESFTSELYGECYQESNYAGFYLWWEMILQAPNGNRYYYGELYSY